MQSISRTKWHERRGNHALVIAHWKMWPGFWSTAIIVVTLGLLVQSPAVWASVTLSVRVVRGGLDLDFGTVEPGQPSRTEELELTMTSTGGGRYRVYQELPDGLVNERGNRLAEDALNIQISRGMTGTPSSGGILPVTQRPQELFISNAAGQSDTLLLAYSVRPDPQLVAGSYRGIVRFTVESLNTKAIVTQIITVRLVVPSLLKLNRQPATPNRVELGQLGPGERSPVVELLLDMVNNTGSPVQLVQELVEPLTTAQGDALPRGQLLYAIVSAQGSQPWRPVNLNPESILTDERGQLRQIRLSYAADIPDNQRAGLYRGTLRVRLVSTTPSEAGEVRFPVEVQVREVFTVLVKPIDGAGDLRFGRGVSGEAPADRSMVVEIKTNIGRSYQVLGGLDHSLVLPTGETLPSNALVWSMSRPPQHGRILLAPNAPVAIGYQPVYQSDATGSSDTFILNYHLTIPTDARDGMYSGQVRFSVTLF